MDNYYITGCCERSGARKADPARYSNLTGCCRRDGSRKADPARFYATQVQYLADNAETQRLNQAAGAALLDRIGVPVLVVTAEAS